METVLSIEKKFWEIVVLGSICIDGFNNKDIQKMRFKSCVSTAILDDNEMAVSVRTRTDNGPVQMEL